LGDCVLTTPALHILKRFRPDLHLAIFVEDRFREIFEAIPISTRSSRPISPLFAASAPNSASTFTAARAALG